MDVYDERQDREKSVFRKLYEGLVGGIAGLLQNRPREEVATQTSISGDIESPQTSTWETMLQIDRKCFFQSDSSGVRKRSFAAQRSEAQADFISLILSMNQSF